MRSRFVFYAATLFASVISIYAQPDKLLQLKEAKTAEDSLDLLTEIADWYLYNKIDSCLYYLNLTISLAERENDAKALSAYYLINGKYIADEVGKTAEGRKNYFYSLHLADSVDYRLGKELAYTELGYNYRASGKLDSSNLYFNAALNIILPDDSIGKASVLNGMALNFKSVGATEQSAASFFEVLNLVGDNPGYQSVVYYNLRLLYESQKNYTEAEKYALLALETAEKGGSKFSIGNAKNALGLIYQKQGQLSEAKVLFEEAEALATSLESAILLAKSKIYLASTHLQQKNWEATIRLINEVGDLLPPDRIYTNFSWHEIQVNYLLEKPRRKPLEALAVMKNFESSYSPEELDELKSDIFKLKSNIYKYIDADQALRYYIKHDSIEDAINSQKIQQYTSLMQTQYETEKKDREIASLSQQATIQSLKLSRRNNQLLIGGLTFAILLTGGLLYYRNYRIKKEKSQAELEQRFLRSQLNPHFIFNSMTAIQNYLMADKDAEQASYYMGMFSSLMRQILENSRQEFITLGEEIKMIKNYLELQKVRFPDFTYEIEVDDDLDVEYSAIPPMFAQPFLENSLEHGLFRDKSKENKISIRFKKKDKNLINLILEDTGIGAQEKTLPSDHNSLATTITRERLASFKASLKEKLGFDNTNIFSSDGEISGYRVNLTLPSEILTTTWR